VVYLAAVGSPDRAPVSGTALRVGRLEASVGGSTLAEALVDVWRQALVDGRAEVEVAGQRSRVTRTRAKGLRVVTVRWGEQVIEGIEQNPATKSRWAQLAQEGKRILQFSCRGRYVANVCEGVLTRYPAWKAQGLPD
jgi:hypothetical protein